jgi:hypothetical protein
MAGEIVSDKILTNSGNPATKYNETPMQDEYYRGWFNTIEQYNDPLVTGYAYIKWFHLPKWVTAEFPAIAQLTEKNLRAFSLPGDIELGMGTTQAGFSTEEFSYVNGITKPAGFQITHKEFSGSPIRKAYTHWVTGIRDPKTGVALYPLADPSLEYCAANHTAELLYVVTRPDATNFANNKIIEFAAYFTNVMPTRAHLAHFNFTAGTQDNPELEQSFTGNMHIGATVDAIALKHIDTGFNNSKPGYEYENTVSNLVGSL